MPIRHGVTQEQIESVRNLVSQGRYSQAWKQLATYGDTYADNAADVTGEPDTILGKIMSELVEQHWEFNVKNDFCKSFPKGSSFVNCLFIKTMVCL